MKVFVQIIDTKLGISQHGMIEEPIQKGFEIANALGHFGVNINDVDWIFEHSNSIGAKIGEVRGTTKVVSIVAI